MAFETVKNKTTTDVMREMLEEEGLTLELGSGLQEASINEGGFISCNFSKRQYFDELVKMTGAKG